MEGQRSFTLVSVNDKANAGGRYISSTPASAARKAGSQICRQKAIRGQCTLYIAVQETTQGSAGKIFYYKIKRVVVNAKVVHNGKKVTHKYAVLAKKDTRKH